MAGDEIQSLLRSGIEAARSGNRLVARRIFEQVIQQDRQNETAWMWLASVADTPDTRREALQKVLSINPNNERAQQALTKLLMEGSQQAASDNAPDEAEFKPVPPPAAAATPRPPKPKTAPLKASPTPRQGRSSRPLILSMMLLALIILGGVAFWVYQQTRPDPVATPIAQTTSSPTPTVDIAALVATLATPTPFIRNTATPIPFFRPADNLPPTWTSTPPPSETPSPTPSPAPRDPADYELVFAGAAEFGGLARLYRLNADGSNLREITINLPLSDSAEAATESDEATARPTPRYEFLEPAFSPDGRLIAFTAQLAPEIQEIFTLDLGSGVVQQITNLEARITNGAAWSPDGAQLAFSSLGNNNRSFDLYLLDLANGDIINLTEGAGQNREPNFSPDGERLVFSSDRETPGELEVWLMDISSRESQRLTRAFNSSFSPAFSNDGRFIAFISNRAGDNDLYIMRANGSDPRLISLDDGNADDRDPSWSPDDEWIALSSTRGGSDVLQLWLLRPDGSQWQQITQSAGISRFVDWSPLLRE